MSSDLDSLFEHAKNISLSAGDILKTHRSNLIDVISESRWDISIEADKKADKLITSALRKISNIKILSEEEEYTSNLEGLYWIIDPLDGTSNYSRNFPIACVSIALAENDKILFGIIYDFYNDVLFEGGLNYKALMNKEQIAVSKIGTKSKGTLMTGPAKGNFNLDIEELNKWMKVRMIGSAAMSCAYVANGVADQYQENGTFIWDIAAGVAIVQAAGGRIDMRRHENKLKVDIVMNNGKIK